MFIVEKEHRRFRNGSRVENRRLSSDTAERDLWQRAISAGNLPRAGGRGFSR
ncbi:MAG: hypothetical protein IPH64_03595 [Comamonadaceae bacterium]|nr:hypothetical protein [Comamonadaceae bacterium]